MRRAALFIAAAALALAACKGEKDRTLAKIGKLKITQSEFDRKLADVSQGYQDYVLTPSGRRQFLDVLIREKLVLAAAQQSAVPGSQDYKARIEQLKKDEAERVRDGSEALLTSLWVDELRRSGPLKVAEEEIESYLQKHPFEIDIRHVLLATPDKAADVAQELRRGASFAKVAEKESLDASTAAQGGRFPSLLYGEVIPELEEVVFRMRQGEIGGPLKSKFGYHVVKKDAERKLNPASRETRDRVTRLLEKQKLDRFLQQMQEKYPVEVVDEQFK